MWDGRPTTSDAEADWPVLSSPTAGRLQAVTASLRLGRSDDALAARDLQERQAVARQLAPLTDRLRQQVIRCAVEADLDAESITRDCPRGHRVHQVPVSGWQSGRHDNWYLHPLAVVDGGSSTGGSRLETRTRRRLRTGPSSADCAAASAGL